MTAAAAYEMLDRVGAGSTGVVYRARHTGSGEVVAIKEVADAVRTDPDALARVRAEARVLSGLAHPNVVRVVEVVDDPDRLWLVLEYVEGAGLGRVLAEHGRLTPEQALLVLRGALTGLGYAHQHGLVHGDVSLDNLLLTVDGTTKLVDFGLAAPAGTTGGVAATPAFASPEVITGAARSPASDVYSAGAVLWTLLAGRPPFPGTDVAAVLRAHVEQPPPRLEGHGPGLADLLDRALAKDPARRPADGAALLAELEHAAEQRFGAGWAAKASLAGLAATATGAHVMASVAGAGAAAGGAPAVAASAVLGVGARAAFSPAKWLWFGAGAAVVAAAVVATVVVTQSSDSPAGGEEIVAEAGGGSGGGGGPAAASQAAELRRSAPTGDYTLQYTVTSDSGVGWEIVGTSATLPWKGLELDCSADTCSGAIPFDNGDGSATFDGTTLEVTGEIQSTSPCHDKETGEEVPGSSGTVGFAFTAVARTSGTAADGRPVLTGTMDVTWTSISTTAGCDPAPTGTSTRDITLTPA
jgi:serine/threonine-protein kinase